MAQRAYKFVSSGISSKEPEDEPRQQKRIRAWWKGAEGLGNSRRRRDA